MITIPIIGKVHSKFTETTSPGIMRREESLIEINEAYAEGLFKIELSDYLEVYFYFDQAGPFSLTTHSYTGEFKGVFATRTPHRPSKIGSTIVKLISCNGNTLKVQGLDALDGTPVVDVKPIHIPFTEEQLNESALHGRKMSPRKTILSNVWAGNTQLLLLDAAAMHGHYCIGLALGVMMATKAMNIIRHTTEGLSDLSVNIESDNSMIDAIQLITGSTLGNKRLTLSNTGQMAFTLTKKNKKSIRISLCDDAEDFLKNAHPLFVGATMNDLLADAHSSDENPEQKLSQIEKAFTLLTLDFGRLFSIEEQSFK